MNAENKILDTPPVENVEPQKTTMDALTESEEFPGIQQNAIDAFNQKTEAAKVENSEPVKLKKDGTPAKKRGRKPNSIIKDPRAKAEEQKAVEQQNLNAKIESRNAANMASGFLENMQIALISEEFKYTETERVANIEAWEKTFDHYGGVSISPPQALMLSHASIILARATQPKTKSKLESFKTKMAIKFLTLKERFKKSPQLDPVELAKDD